MRSFWTVLGKDLRRKLRSPLAAIVYLAFPIVFALLIGVTFGSSGENVAPIRIALFDEDRGFASRALKSSFGQSQATQRFEVRPVDTMEEGLRLIEDDKVSALVRIPPGFTDSLFDGRGTTLEVVKNPAEGIYPQIAEEYVETLAYGGGAAVRVLGGPLRAIHASSQRKTAPTDAFIADVSVAINHTMRGVGRYALPPAIRVHDVKQGASGNAARANDSPLKIALLILPGMAVFSILMMSVGSMVDFPREIARGTLQRQITAPVPASHVILGKTASTMVLALACVLLLAVVAVVWAGAGIGSAPAFLVLSLAFALAATGFAAFFQSVSRSERTAAVVSSFFVMIMSLFGGTWIPLDSLSPALRRLAPYTLTYWAGEGYRRVIFDNAGIAQLALNIAVLAVIGAVLSAISVVLFRRRFEGGA